MNSPKPIDEVVEDFEDCPVMFTNHVPEPKPDSVKVTVNTLANVMDMLTFAPLIVKEPADGEGTYLNEDKDML